MFTELWKYGFQSIIVLFYKYVAEKQHCVEISYATYDQFKKSFFNSPKLQLYIILISLKLPTYPFCPRNWCCSWLDYKMKKSFYGTVTNTIFYFFSFINHVIYKLSFYGRVTNIIFYFVSFINRVIYKLLRCSFNLYSFQNF